MAADTAIGNSNDAVTSSSRALSLARGARQEADTFEKRIGGAEHKADEAEQHLAESLKHANEAEAEANRLKKRFSDRVVDPQRLARNINRFSGQEFRVTMYGNGEPVRVANELYSALLLAKWIPQGQEEPRGLFPGITGIEIYVHPNASATAKDAANSLLSELRSQGLQAVIRAQIDPQNTTPNKSRLEINVGTKE